MVEREGSDMALKLLHTADWHLGQRFRALPPESEVRLTRARLEVVARILDLAERRNVDAVLCAGDLFDQPSPEPEWWQGLSEELRRRGGGRPVFLLPGNHDPLTPRSVYDPSHPFRRELPAHVHVVDRDDFTFELGDGAVLYGVPCRSQAGQSELCSKIPRREAGDARIRIGLVHGQTFDIDGHQTTFPIPRGAAADRGLDYLAIGDTHGFREVEASPAPPTVYPGAPEPTSFRETDAGHVALVFFPRDRARRALVERHHVAAWAWREQRCGSLADLRALRADDGLKRCVLRLKLDMRLPLAEYDEAERLLVELGGSLSASPRVGVLLADRTDLRLAGRREDFPADLPPVLQSVVDRLLVKAAETPTEARTVERAMHHLFTLVRRGAG